MRSQDKTLDEKVLAALEAIQSERTTLRSKLAYLGWSLLCYLFIGWFLTTDVIFENFGSDRAVIVVIMLFIHEIGHYLVMNRFGYKNLKIFLVPFFGGVSGYACLPVVKTSIVYLVGPIPGIWLGCIAGLIYLFTHQEIWLDVASIFIMFNTLSLLPFYPFDGGRFVFNIFPQRTYRIQWLFQIVFAFLPILLVWRFALSFVAWLILFIVISSINFYKHNKMAAELLASGIITPEMSDTIPSEIVPKLISIVQREMGYSQPQEITETLWTIWARVKAEQPTLRERIYLIVVYLVTLALGVGLSLAYFSL